MPFLPLRTAVWQTPKIEMMKQTPILTLLLFSLIFAVTVRTEAQTTYRKQAIDPKIKTLQVYPADNPIGFPFIEFGGEHKMEISFDKMEFAHQTFFYKIVHCNRDWSKSPLTEMEFYDGLATGEIEDVNLSQSTVVNYTNYRLRLPQDGERFKVSGNYAVVISENIDFAHISAVVCFYVAERNVAINAKSTSKTLSGFNTHYQQLEIEVNHPAYPIGNPMAELNLNVLQNRRHDNARLDLKPSFTTPTKQTYANMQPLVFEGGNEYRFIDFADPYRYSGQIDKIEVKADYYNVYTTPAYPRNRSYLPSNYGNANGRYIINRKDYDNDYYKADYMEVNFILPNSLEFYNYDIYLLGDLTDNRLDEHSRLTLDQRLNIYHLGLSLKEGGYSFLYAFVPKNCPKASHQSPCPTTLIPFEGSFWQTQNEYVIMLYHTPFGAKYDKLIGIHIIKNINTQ